MIVFIRLLVYNLRLKFFVKYVWYFVDEIIHQAEQRHGPIEVIQYAKRNSPRI
jgi:hypothetical protein